MHSISEVRDLNEIGKRVVELAEDKFGMTLPEMRFFVLDSLEFASLLEKSVYPTSPVNIWEGKRMTQKKHRIETGMESALYYEVVQTGNPSYAYLNDGNSAMTQASVMAHVCGHCEFSELNVLGDSDNDRTEYVAYLVRKVDLARRQMGEKKYMDYWNACESVIPFIAPNSQYKLENSVEKESSIAKNYVDADEDEMHEQSALDPYSASLAQMLRRGDEDRFDEYELKRQRSETLSRRGYHLKAPCQDVAGFLRFYAPTSSAERQVLDYLYVCHEHQDFVIRTQIMNEGWAMYWEKAIMLELFREGTVKGIIDYAKIFSGVCYPRPYFARNPYHLGYHMWGHIEQLYREGKVSSAYHEEKDMDAKEQWRREAAQAPIQSMRHLVRSVTDYEFLRRFLTSEWIREFHLNRIPRHYAQQMRLEEDDIEHSDKQYIWLYPEGVKEQMLQFFVHFHRPRIYVIDAEFLDGGLLLYHRFDGRQLRRDWIKPTLRNIHNIWKSPVYLLSGQNLYGNTAEGYDVTNVEKVSFEQIAERMSQQKKPFQLN